MKVPAHELLERLVTSTERIEIVKKYEATLRYKAIMLSWAYVLTDNPEEHKKVIQDIMKSIPLPPV